MTRIDRLRNSFLPSALRRYLASKLFGFLVRMAFVLASQRTRVYSCYGLNISMKIVPTGIKMTHTFFREAMAFERSPIWSSVSSGSVSVRWGKTTLISGHRASHLSWSSCRKSLTVSSTQALMSCLTWSWRNLSCSGVRSHDFPIMKKIGRTERKSKDEAKAKRETCETTE